MENDTSQLENRNLQREDDCDEETETQYMENDTSQLENRSLQRKEDGDEESQEPETCYEKPGTDGLHGFWYEVDMCTFIFLKLLNLRSSFNMRWNSQKDGDFDDLVIKCSYEMFNGRKENNTLFIQLKHAERDTAKHIISILKSGKKKSKKLYLEQYYTSFCSDLQAKECSESSNRWYIIWTNSDLNKSLLVKDNNMCEILKQITFCDEVFRVKENEVKCVGEFYNMIQKISDSSRFDYDETQFDSDVSSLLSSTKDVGYQNILKGVKYGSKTDSLIQKYKNFDPRHIEEFYKKLRICCNQGSADKINEFIDNEIQIALPGATPLEVETARDDLNKRMKEWRRTSKMTKEGRKVDCLTQGSKLWKAIVLKIESSRIQQLSTELSNLGMTFSDESLNPIGEHVNNIKCNVLNFVCSGKLTTAAMLKVWQVLSKLQTHIFVSIADCGEDNKTLWRTWPSWWCHTLVIHCGTFYEGDKQFVDKIAACLKRNPQASVVFVSPQSNDWKLLFGNVADIMYSEFEVDSIFSHLVPESQKKLCEKKINFQGKLVKFGSIVEKCDIGTLSSDYLSYLIKNDTVQLGSEICAVKNKDDIYIPRRIAIPRISFNVFLTRETNVIIAFEFEFESHHQQYVNSGEFCSVKEIQEKDQSLNRVHNSKFEYNDFKFILLSRGKEEKEYEILCERYDNVHWIKACDQGLFWKKTKGNTTLIKEYLERSVRYYRHKERNLSELAQHVMKTCIWNNEICEKCEECCDSHNHYSETARYVHKYIMDIYNWDIKFCSERECECNKGWHYCETTSYVNVENFLEYDITSPVLITDEPGMGKSTILYHISLSLKQRYPNKWVTLINLLDHCQYLNSIQCVDRATVEILIKDSLNLNTIENEFFHKIANDLTNFIVLLDAFDEICPIYYEKVIYIIKLLTSACFYVYVTSRSNMENYLEKELSVVSCNLEPFDTVTQLLYLCKFWEKMHGYSTELRKCGLKIQNYFSNHCPGEHQFMLRNPLFLKTVAEIYSDVISKTEFDHFKIINILQVFDIFVKKKCEILFSEKKKLDLHNPMAESDIRKFHDEFMEKNKCTAVLQLFSNEAFSDYQQIGKMREIVSAYHKDIKEYIDKTGFVVGVEYDIVKYRHRCYEEYFAAMWLVDNYREATLITEDIFERKVMEGVKLFFDFKICGSCPLHMAIITKNREQIKSIMKGIAINYETDLLGRTALHIAASYSDIETVELLIRKNANVNIKDNIGWTPERYAMASGCRATESMLRHFAKKHMRNLNFGLRRKSYSN